MMKKCLHMQFAEICKTTQNGNTTVKYMHLKHSE